MSVLDYVAYLDRCFQEAIYARLEALRATPDASERRSASPVT